VLGETQDYSFDEMTTRCASLKGAHFVATNPEPTDSPRSVRCRWRTRAMIESATGSRRTSW